MISTVLAMTLAGAAMQSDTTRAAREAYNACLRQFMTQSVQARTSPADFESGLAQQCATQETAFRTAVLQRETGIRATRATAERTAGEEVGESRSNFLERYRMTMQPQ